MLQEPARPKENEMSRIYEIMYLLDNNAVRAGWKEAKAAATGLIEKHGGKVLSARRWDERKLAYSIRQRRRGTYLLAYGALEADGVATLRRELDLTESVLRYLILSAESVPAQELELTQAESSAGFIVPGRRPRTCPRPNRRSRKRNPRPSGSRARPASCGRGGLSHASDRYDRGDRFEAPTYEKVKAKDRTSTTRTSSS
jgi:small subunit ribosomal protein S6